MPPINFLSWLPKAILSIVKFQFNVIKFLVITVPKYVFKVVEFLVDKLIIGYIRFYTNYFIKITDWIASGDAGDYFSMVIVNYYEFYYFQWQEILNTVIKNSFGVFKIPPIKAIKLDELLDIGNKMKLPFACNVKNETAWEEKIDSITEN